MPSTSKLTTRSAEETRAAGRRLGQAAAAGDVLLLVAPLGAGKTVLVQGIAEGLGYTDDVVSPTFVLVRQYAARLELVHADLYRLDHPLEVAALGLLQLSADGVLVVEWADRAAWVEAPDAARLAIDPGARESGRELRLEGGPERFHQALVGAIARQS